MRRILEFPLATFPLGLWRLGQSGLVIRSRGGPVVAVDPCLTEPTPEWMPLLRRRFPPPFPPEALTADVVLVTHAHPHHFDPGTLAASPVRDQAQMIAPPGVIGALGAMGVAPDRLHSLEPGRTWEGPGLTVRGVKAWHAADVPDALGFRLALAPATLFVTGDTRAHAGLREGAPADVLVVPINGKRGNMGPEEAAALVAELQPRYAVPCHYDLISADGEDPDAFVLHLTLLKQAERCRVLPLLSPLLLGEDGSAVVADGPLEMAWTCGRGAPPADPPPPYRLRPFRNEDVPDLARIFQRVFGPAHDEPWFRREVAAAPWFSADRVFVIELHGRPVATAAAWEDETVRARHHGLLQWVATDPDHHERGLGKTVTAAAMRYFQKDGRRGVTLRTDDRRLRAIRAYQALGFEPVLAGDESARRWANVQEAARRESAEGA